MVNCINIVHVNTYNIKHMLIYFMSNCTNKYILVPWDNHIRFI